MGAGSVGSCGPGEGIGNRGSLEGVKFIWYWGRCTESFCKFLLPE